MTSPIDFIYDPSSTDEDRGDEWPPPPFQPAVNVMNRYASWWIGDPGMLSHAFGNYSYPSYSGSVSTLFPDRNYLWAGNFWAQQTPDGEENTKIHYPLASSIATVSANLLFGKAPKVTFEDEATQEFFDALEEDGLFTKLHEGAQTASAMGGVFIYVCWDETVSDTPFLDVAPPDVAFPHFSPYGKLKDVTFWRVIAEDDDDNVVRWLETHAPGMISHKVFEGDRQFLGQPVSLDSYPETADLVEIVDEDGVIFTGTQTLTAVYVPNMKPAKQWRGYPALKDFGDSDFADIEGLMDSLDASWSQHQEELRLARLRLFVDDSIIETMGQGQGAYFDIDKKLFIPIDARDDTGQVAGNLITPFGPAIRTQDFVTNNTELLKAAVDGAGYSSYTFNLDPQVAQTAAEVEARQEKTLSTRSQKITYWTTGLQQALFALLSVAQLKFEIDVIPNKPTIDFQPYIQPGAEELGQSVSMLRTAGVMSVETAVRYIHPDWTDDQVDTEVALLKEEAPPGPIEMAEIAQAQSAGTPIQELKQNGLLDGDSDSSQTEEPSTQ